MSSSPANLPSSGSKPALPVIEYSPRSEIRTPGRLLGDIFHDFVAGREIAWRFFLRNLRGMYRQTLLGLFWAFLPPIANTAMWVFLKSQNVFSMGDTVVDGTVYILAGMILWQAFVDAFQMPLNKLRSNKNMLCRIRFPRESLLLVGVGEVLFDLAIRLVLLIPAFVIFQVPLQPTVLLAIPAILALVTIGLAFGLLILPAGSLYQDVGRLITLALPFWMIITPIIYVPPETYPGTLLNWLNPAAPLLILSRDWLLLGGTQHLLPGLIVGALAIPLLLLGLILYRISLPLLIERMQA